MRLFRIVVGPLVAALILAPAGCDGQADQEPAAQADKHQAAKPTGPAGSIQAVPVHLEQVVLRSLRQRVELAGTAEARRECTVSAEVTGQVAAMLADAGDHLAAGEPICRMRRLPVELQLRRAEGQLAAEKAELRKMERGFRPEEIRQAEARTRAARAASERWKREYERTKQLLADGASFPAEMEVVEASHRQAQEQLAEAEAGLDLLKRGYREEDVDKARAEVQAEEAAVGELRDRLDKMTVAMPFDGFIVEKLTEHGAWLSPGAPVADIVDLGAVRVLLDVPERYIGGLEKGAEARVVFPALGDREFVGTISQVVPASSEGAHTVPVRVDVENPFVDGRPTIASGLFARVWLPVGEAHEGLLVPKAAVIRQQGEDLVYTVSREPPPEPAQMLKKPARAASTPGAKPAEAPSTRMPPVQFAVAVPIRIVQGHGRYMEVESDLLKPGMEVITRGTYVMRPGMPVQVFPKEGSGGETGPGEPADAAGKDG